MDQSIKGRYRGGTEHEANRNRRPRWSLDPTGVDVACRVGDALGGSAGSAGPDEELQRSRLRPFLEGQPATDFHVALSRRQVRPKHDDEDLQCPGEPGQVGGRRT